LKENKSVTLEELTVNVAEILEIEPSELLAESTVETVETWDSMASLGIISMLDDETDGDITAEDADALISFEAVVDLARAKGIIGG